MGAAGEVVSINWLEPETNAVVSVSCTIGESLSTSVAVPARTCTDL